MHFLRRLVHEAHRRSLWQVLSIYLAVSWVVLQVVEVVTESAGLPDWTQGFAFVLLLIGLPIVLGTAFIQEGVAAPGQEGWKAPRPRDHDVPGLPAAGAVAAGGGRAGAHRHLFTWRNAVMGGAGAFGVLAISVVMYGVMWSAGIGPVGSLTAQGVIAEGDEVILADFENTTGDASLGDVVTEALRVDLTSAGAIRLVEPRRVRETLALMGRAEDPALTAEVAREVAVRDGIKAVLSGNVGSAGTGYILVASLESAAGETLATFRRTADGPDGVILAIDKLSQDVRERTGESLRRIRAEAPLEAYTTSSLEALRKYAEAERVGEEGDVARARVLLEEALALDPAFAMAWRKLSVVLQTAGGSQSEQAAAATRAWELRDRLTDLERYLATAYYHGLVTGDIDARMQAYRSALAVDPDNGTALNNLANALAERTRYAEAVELLRRAVDGPGRSAPAMTNLGTYLAMAGDVEAAREQLAALRAAYPNRSLWPDFVAFTIEMSAGDLPAARAAMERIAADPASPSSWKGIAAWLIATTDVGEGRAARGLARLRDAGAAARAAGLWEEVLMAEGSAAALESAVLKDRAAAVARLQRAMPLLDSVPPTGRPYLALTREFAAAGAIDAARSVLAHWARLGGATAEGTGRREAIQLVDLMAQATADPSAAAATLDAFRRTGGCPRCEGFLLGQLYARAGDGERAIAAFEQVIREPERWTVSAYERVLAHERLGTLYDERGDATRAVEHYRAFADAWADADASLQPRVRHARTRIAALGG